MGSRVARVNGAATPGGSGEGRDRCGSGLLAAVSGRFQECSSSSPLVGLAHSHPIAPDGTVNCWPSHTDVADLGRPWRVIVVVCGATDAAVKLGFRAGGRHPVVRTLTVRGRPVPLHLGGWGDVSARLDAGLSQCAEQIRQPATSFLIDQPTCFFPES